MTEAEQLRVALADALQQIQEAASARLNVVIQMKNTIAELEKALAKAQEVPVVKAEDTKKI